MTQGELAKASGLGLSTIMRFETSDRVTKSETVDTIRRALEARGIEFSNGGEPGVKLRPSKAVIPV